MPCKYCPEAFPGGINAASLIFSVSDAAKTAAVPLKAVICVQKKPAPFSTRAGLIYLL
jgi:hypothetical protein